MGALAIDAVVCWKWTPARGFRSHFGASTVNVLRRMVARHYARPHRFICVTDDPRGLDAAVEAIPLWREFATLLSPWGPKQPSCYRRLRAFAADVGQILGQRFVSLDLDTVVVGDLVPLWERPEDFVIWQNTTRRTTYNGSMFLLRAGTRTQVYDRFDPRVSPLRAKAAGQFGSDQGWISYCLGRGQAVWTQRDGVYSYRNDLKSAAALPSDARIVFFHGAHDPWSPECQRLPWVRAHYQ